MDNKRKNFSDIEAEAFLVCLDKFKLIVENKKTDAVSNNKKAKAWEELTVMFNRFPGVSKRKVNQLLNYHKNMKRNRNKIKKRLENCNLRDYATSNLAEESGKIKTPLINCYDSDESSHKTTTDNTHCENRCNQEKSHEIIEVQFAAADFTECEYDVESSDDDFLMSPSIPSASLQSQVSQIAPSQSIKRESGPSNTLHDVNIPNKNIYKLKRIKKHLSAKAADALIQQVKLKTKIFNEQHELERDKFVLEKEKFAMKQEKQDTKLRLMNEQIKMYELINEKLEKGEGIQICININK